MLVGHDDQDPDDHGHAEHVPAHGDVVEEGHERRGEDVDQGMEREDRHEQHERLGQDVLGVAEVHEAEVQAVEAEEHVHELGARVVHRGHHAHEPDEVEPAGEPAPGLAAQLGGPPVDAAGGGIAGHQLGHREGHQQDQPADDRPAPADRDRAAAVPGHEVAREASGEYRDDREGDGEVGEAAPTALEGLRIAELCESLLVLAYQRLLRGLRWWTSSRCLPSLGTGDPALRREWFGGPTYSMRATLSNRNHAVSTIGASVDAEPPWLTWRSPWSVRGWSGVPRPSSCAGAARPSRCSRRSRRPVLPPAAPTPGSCTPASTPPPESSRQS